MAININECTSADSNSSVCKNVDGIPRNATSWIYVVWREGKHVRISNKSGSIGVHHWLTHFLVSHPSYHGSNEWYDWAMVWWHKHPQDDSNFTEKPHLWFGEYTHTVSSFQYSPAQILGFIVFPSYCMTHRTIITKQDNHCRKTCLFCGQLFNCENPCFVF